MRTFIAVAATATASMVACSEGGDDPAQQAASPAATDHCQEVPAPAIRALSRSLKAGATIASAKAIESTADSPLRGFRDSGLYFVAASLRGDVGAGGIARWAVSGDFLETGGGLAIGADEPTAKRSRLGDLFEGSVPGLDTSSDGYSEVATCLEVRQGRDGADD